MKQLFLCSYFAGVKKLFSDYAKEKNLENKVLFITRIKEKATPISYQRANKRWAGLCGRISRGYHCNQGY